MDSFAAYNDGFKFILCVDVFSKFAWAIPLKTKKGTEILKSVKAVIKDSDREPEKIWDMAIVEVSGFGSSSEPQSEQNVR